ncbi:MAG: hypothetical protein ABSG32_15020 [Terriglobia bacterium]|jgi:hypothetical protein
MSLTTKRKVTERNLAANRLNAHKSHGPTTPAGKAHSAAAGVRHGYYSQSAEVALAALGEDPAMFKQRLESLMRTYEPANALEMGVLFRMARSLWRAERFDRIQESMAVKHLERVLESKRQMAALGCAPLFDRLQRLKDLCYATCAAPNAVVRPEGMRLFENACHDVPEEKARQILRLLLRLREIGTAEVQAPEAWLLPGDDEVPVAEGEEREAARVQLLRTLEAEIDSLSERIMRPDEDPNKVRAQFDRDEILAAGHPKAALMNRGEESSLRQLWRSTDLLLKIKEAARKEENIENEGRPRGLYENKGRIKRQNVISR